MKLLILSAPGGSGHIQAAKALEATAKQDPEITDVRHINIISFFPKTALSFLIQWYEYGAKNTPSVWGALYKMLNNITLSTTLQDKSLPIFQKAYKQKLNTFKKEIDAYNPDHIICTHPLPRLVIKDAPYKTSIVITDYAFHPLWIVNTHDYYFVATNEIQDGLQKNKVLKSNTTVSGIPVHPVFFEEKDSDLLRKKYKIETEENVVLVLTGGKGIYNPSEYVEELQKSKEPLNIIVIAGDNEKLKRDLEKIKTSKQHKYTVLGWTEAVDEYMRIANCIITKPGGLTISECMVLQKQILLVSPIPGQEEKNMKMLCDWGVAIYVKKPEDTLKYIQKNITQNIKPQQNASQTILQKIKKLP